MWKEVDTPALPPLVPVSGLQEGPILMTFGPEECCFDSKAMAEKGVADKEAGMDWVHHR